MRVDSAAGRRFAARLDALELERDDLTRRLRRSEQIDACLWPVERGNELRRRLREVHTLIVLVGRVIEFEERYRA